MRRLTMVLPLVLLGLTVPVGAAGAADEGGSIGFGTANTGPGLTPGGAAGRVLVAVDGAVTGAVLEELSAHGYVHGWIDRYGLVAMTPKGKRARAAVADLPFVSLVEDDQLGGFTDVATWERDIIDVADVEESGIIGDPDPREVAGTGTGVHVAVIDTGLIREWREFLPEARVDTSLARAFLGGGALGSDLVPVNEFNTSDPTDLWERDTFGHGTGVASLVTGFHIGPFGVHGAAPDAKVIPLKVTPGGADSVRTSRVIAAIAYVIELKESGAVGSVVINMSFVFSSPSRLVEAAIDDAIESGVIAVAAAGNAGENGMSWPGAYPQVISAGATGWTEQLLPLVNGAPNFEFWWNQDVAEGSEVEQSYVTDFSSRAIPTLSQRFGVAPQELDVLAPGSGTVAPCLSGFRIDAGPPGSAGFCFWVGTSFASPLTAGVAAIMLEKNPGLTQAGVEAILRDTALPIDPVDVREGVLFPPFEFIDQSWDTNCHTSAGETLACDPVGSGLLQAEAAVAATP
ncbi:MAG: S8 family peptidase [Actinomycetota bacterium]